MNISAVNPNVSQTSGTTSANNGPEASIRQRISSLDIVRGFVMVLMAIDHVRVYSGLPAGGPTAGIFFTRWVTHFVAPAFVFLAGTGAFLYGRKVRKRSELAIFLLSRGALLIALELTVIRIAWTFNFDFAHYLLAGVIWMLGWCMILLAAIIWLPLPAIAGFGLTVVCLHNLLDYYGPVIVPRVSASSLGWVAQVLYYGGPIELRAGGPELQVLYSLIPWIGVIACGYAFGYVMVLSRERRKGICLGMGTIAIALFLLLRGFDIYGDPRPWNHPPRRIAVAHQQQQGGGGGVQGPNSSSSTASQTAPKPRPAPPRMNPVLRMLNTAKYPASLSFLLMTLGPMFLAIALAERCSGRISQWMETFGRVPMFYYLLHIPLIHLLAVCVSLVRSPAATAWLFANHPMSPPQPPEGYVWSLGLLYAVWAVAVVMLYFPCRWYSDLKASKRSKWLSYI